MQKIRSLSKPSLWLATLGAAALIMGASGPLATVTSTAPFQLHGAGVPAGVGVPSWPVMAGDTLQTGIAPVTLTFADGSTLLLDPASSAKLEMSGLTPRFQLQAGTVHYSLVTLSAVKLMALSDAVIPPNLTGSYTIHNDRPAAAGWWTLGHTTLFLAGAGASAALGLGIAATIQGGPSVSPSR